jgi:hypothetical protein
MGVRVFPLRSGGESSGRRLDGSGLRGGDEPEAVATLGPEGPKVATLGVPTASGYPSRAGVRQRDPVSTQWARRRRTR